METSKNGEGITIANWVNIEEKMPPKDGYYLVATPAGSVAVSFYTENASFFNHYCGKPSGEWSMYYGEKSKFFEYARRWHLKIQFWAFLPSPPLGEA